MIISKSAINRRAVLRGIGTALTLPFLDAMVPALSAMPKPVNRFGVVYLPNGMMMENWTPATVGAGFELSPILSPLEPYRNHMLVLSGLSSTPPPERANALVGNHSRASTRFLTDVQPKPTLGSDLEAGVSMDQIAANEIGQQTPLASLELGLDSNETTGGGDTGYSRAYCGTISWRGPRTPLPMENNPRAVFERLFGDTASTSPDARIARIRQERSILDSVTEKIARLNGKLAPSDTGKLDEFLSAVRDIERRIQATEKQSDQPIPLLEHPAGIPASFVEHLNLMFDLYALAYQCNQTRVITLMVGREFNGRTYPELGVHDGHHATSHHQNDPAKLADLIKINTYHVKLFTYFLEKLRSTPDGDGSLLDHVMLLYGAGMSDGNSHSPKNLPVLLMGGGAGQLKTGRHVKYKMDTPLANLHIALLDKLGVRTDKIGDSNGECDHLSEV